MSRWRGVFNSTWANPSGGRPSRSRNAVNTAWAFGELIGPTVGGALAEAAGDPAPYLVGASLCLLTFAATYRVAGRMRPHEA